jgi:phenylacetate-CoA ligase
MRQYGDFSTTDAKFRRIVNHARKNNPFYAEWLREPGRIPILDRKTFLDNNDKILNGNEVTARTSGSTGIPVRISKPQQSVAVDAQDTERLVEWLGGRVPVIQILHLGDKPSERDRLDINTPVPAQIDYLLKSNQDWEACGVTTYPTNAMMLAQHVLERGLDMGCYRRVGMIGEPFEPAQRAYVQSAFPRAQIWSSYSSMEFGMIAAQCPHEDSYQHIMSHKLLVEVLDEEDRPCEPGRVGRVIVTDYYNTACPFIRYEIGDLAVRRQCPCGWIPLPAFGEIHGKVRGALRHRSGKRIMFIDLSVAIRDLPGMRQYQVIQETLDDFTVKVVAPEDVDEGIRKAFVEHFGYLPNLTIEHLDVIHREASGKFHASICKV